MVHTAIICTKSSFFERATSTSENVQHETNRSIELLTVDAAVFEAYLHWVYSSNIDEVFLNRIDFRSSIGHDHMGIAKLWLLGAFLEDQHFSNELMDRTLYFLSDSVQETRNLNRYLREVVEHVWVTQRKPRSYFRRTFSGQRPLKQQRCQ